MKYNFIRFPGGKTKAVTLSYDDGSQADIRFLEIINKYGLKCTFNLNSELLGTEFTLKVLGEDIDHIKVNKNDVKSIYSGHEVAAHTLTHPFLPELSSDEIVRQVETDRLNLSELVGYEVVGMAYPCGGENSNEYVANTIKAATGIKYARTIRETLSFKGYENLHLFNPTFSLTKDTDKIESITDAFFKNDTDEVKLLYVWGHSYEFDAGNRWGILEDFCRNISGKDDVLYCTNKEAFEFLGII